LNYNDFYDLADGPALALGVMGTKTASNRPEFPGDREQGALDTFFLSHELKRLSARIDPLSPPSRPFDRDEVLVCMALAFCLAGASTSLVYRLLG
jgi:hypothetical protein